MYTSQAPKATGNHCRFFGFTTLWALKSDLHSTV